MQIITAIACVIGIATMFGEYFIFAAILGAIHGAAEAENAELEAGRDG